MKRAMMMAGLGLTLGGCSWFSMRDPVPEVVSLSAVAPLEVSAGPMVEALAVAPGAEIYADNCLVCHGETGRGDGALGAPLPVVPADLTGLATANGGVYPAQRVLNTVHGTPGPFHRGTMPDFRAVLDGPVREWRAPDGSVILTPKGLIDVVAYVGSLQSE